MLEEKAHYDAHNVHLIDHFAAAQICLQRCFKLTLCKRETEAGEEQIQRRKKTKTKTKNGECGTFQLTRVGIGVAVSFGPLVGGSLLVEVVLRLHQRERLCEEGATAYRLMVPQTAVTAALLRAIRQVKRDAPL